MSALLVVFSEAEKRTSKLLHMCNKYIFYIDTFAPCSSDSDIRKPGAKDNKKGSSGKKGGADKAAAASGGDGDKKGKCIIL